MLRAITCHGRRWPTGALPIAKRDVLRPHRAIRSTVTSARLSGISSSIEACKSKPARCTGGLSSERTDWTYTNNAKPIIFPRPAPACWYDRSGPVSDTPRKPFNPPPVGEPVNLFGALNHFYIPTSLGTLKTLSWFEKLLYGYLRFLAGDSDHCQVSLRKLADTFDVSYETVRRAIDSLIAAKLIRRKLGPSGSVFTFLWSERLRGSIPKPKESDSATVLTPHASGLRNGVDSTTVQTPQRRGRGSATASDGSATVCVGSAPVPGPYKEEGLSSGLSSGLSTGVIHPPTPRADPCPPLRGGRVIDDPPGYSFRPAANVGPGYGDLSDQQAVWFAEFWQRYSQSGAKLRAAKVFAKNVRTVADWHRVRAALADPVAALGSDHPPVDNGAQWLDVFFGKRLRRRRTRR